MLFFIVVQSNDIHQTIYNAASMTQSGIHFKNIEMFTLRGIWMNK